MAEIVSTLGIKYTNAQTTDNQELINLTEKVKFAKFFQALRPDFKLEVKKLGPSNFEAALKIATKIESALKDSHNTNQHIVHQIELNLLQQQLTTNQNIEKLT